MQSWLEYLAFLYCQGQALHLRDFEKVFQNREGISTYEQLPDYISHPETVHYMRSQKDWCKQAKALKQKFLADGVKCVWIFHPDYPKELLKMESPPVVISWKGHLDFKSMFLLSIVGSRNPHQDTLMWMDMHLSTFLQRRQEKLCILSGGARGVDQKAHALALSHQQATLCFLPCGITNYYPSSLQKWEKHIIDGGGALVSVFPPLAQMQKSHFHIRNKALAFLSHLVLIMQAQLRSGTMVTARYAMHAGANIAVLPGSPLYASFSGNLSLINDGCFMVRDHLDLETLYQSSRLVLSS